MGTAEERRGLSGELPPRREDDPGDDGNLQLMERIRAGEAAAMDELVRTYWGPLRAYLANLTGSRDAAEDLAQDTFLRVWEHRAAWRPSGSVRGYVYRIARNLALNVLEARETRPRLLRRWLRPQRGPRTPEDLLAGEELQRAVDAAVAALPERRREVLTLVRFHGLSYREAAEAMGIAPRTVANQMSSALAQLRRSLEPFLEPGEPPRHSPPPGPSEPPPPPALRLLEP